MKKFFKKKRMSDVVKQGAILVHSHTNSTQHYGSSWDIQNIYHSVLQSRIPTNRQNLKLKYLSRKGLSGIKLPSNLLPLSTVQSVYGRVLRDEGPHRKWETLHSVFFLMSSEPRKIIIAEILRSPYLDLYLPLKPLHVLFFVLHPFSSLIIFYRFTTCNSIIHWQDGGLLSTKMRKIKKIIPCSYLNASVD